MFYLLCDALLTNVSMFLNATPTQGAEYPNVNSVTTGDPISQDYGAIMKWVTDGLTYVGKSLLNCLDPFLNWGCKTIIVACYLIFYCSGERKYIATGLKFGIIFVIYCEIWGALL
jgi:hypothetical protein